MPTALSNDRFGSIPEIRSRREISRWSAPRYFDRQGGSQELAVQTLKAVAPLPLKHVRPP
jgi:hypothetical protein